MLHSAVSTIRAFLDLTAAEDTILETLADQVEQLAENYCGRKLATASRTVYLDGNAEEYLFLPEPAESILAPRVDSGRDFESGDALDSDEYALEDDGVRVRRLDSTWTQGDRNIRIICTVGFATIPDDLLLMENMEVGRWYQRMKEAQTGDINLDAQTIRGWAMTFSKREGLSDESKDTLKYYKVASL